jgi:hypothetical protein
MQTPPDIIRNLVAVIHFRQQTKEFATTLNTYATRENWPVLLWRLANRPVPEFYNFAAESTVPS